MENSSKNRIYEFDTFRLDADKLMLYRDGMEISMPPKMVKTLVVLVEDRGTIISKDELIDRVWSDAIVDESNLSQHLYHLRKILGLQPDGRPYIETFRRRGYRFNGDVSLGTLHSTHERATANEPISAPIPVISTGPSVHRSGNVLRLEDWKTSAERAPKIAFVEPAHAEPATPAVAVVDQPKRSISLLAMTTIGAGMLIAIALATMFVIYRTDFGSRTGATSNELSMLRLTNGIKPSEVALSPNGDQLVYHEITPTGEAVWLQQVGQSSRVQVAEPVAGRSYGPKTFSPDGKTIFLSVFANNDLGTGTLYRVPILGGPQTKVLDDVNRPISFSPDGKQFALIRESKPGEVWQLEIVQADGTGQKSILEARKPYMIIGSPAWSPDGSTIVFAGTGFDGDLATVPRLYRLDLEKGSVRKISDEGWDNVYRIVFTADGLGLVMIATRANEGYSTRRDQVYFVSYPEGQSRRLTSDGSRHQAWSLGTGKDNTIMAVPFNRSSQIWSMDASGDTASAFQITRGIADGRAGIAPLPDGRVGFISRSGEEIDVWVMNPDGSDLRQLTAGLRAVEELRADPLGRYFIISVWRDKHNHIYRFDVDGKDLRQVTFGDGHEIDTTMSPDGKRIVFGSSVHPMLFTVPVDGGDPVPISDAKCWTPYFSPDGGLISCVIDRRIEIRSATDGKLIRDFRLPFYALDNFGARWLPSGKGLVYISSEGGLANIWMQPIDGAAPRPLTNFTFGDIHNFAFSRDGSRLFVARGQQISDVVLISNYR